MQQAMADAEAKRGTLAKGNLPQEAAANDHRDKRPPRDDAGSFQLALPELTAIERYERRALSRRRRAMEAFRYIRSARSSRRKVC